MMLVGIVIAVIIVYFFIMYNQLISNRNRVKQAESGIDVYLTQRFDLIPNLVECVKGYIKHEQETLDSIIEMKERYKQTKNLKDGEILNNKCNKIMAVAENYPELKASEQFLNLQKSLTKIESQLQASRRIYNAEVNLYNNKVQMFPSNIVANMFHFEEKEFFQMGEHAKNNVEIKEKLE